MLNGLGTTIMRDWPPICIWETPVYASSGGPLTVRGDCSQGGPIILPWTVQGDQCFGGPLIVWHPKVMPYLALALLCDGDPRQYVHFWLYIAPKPFCRRLQLSVDGWLELVVVRSEALWSHLSDHQLARSSACRDDEGCSWHSRWNRYASM